MLYKLAPVVTKPSTETTTGYEVVSYPKEHLDLIEVVALFKASRQCIPDKDYVIVEWPHSTHYSIHHLEKL